MKTYSVEFTQTIMVNANSEEEARDKAYERMEFQPGNFYTYVREEEYNSEYEEDEE